MNKIVSASKDLEKRIESIIKDWESNHNVSIVRINYDLIEGKPVRIDIGANVKIIE